MTSPDVYAFERIDNALPFIPLAARRVLDTLGRKLSLEGWLSLTIDDRRRLVRAGAAACVDPTAASVLEAAIPAPAKSPPQSEPDENGPPRELTLALGAARPLDESKWKSLHPLERYTLVKVASKPEKLALAYHHIVGLDFPHLTRTGEARMVQVGEKSETRRCAVASACVRTTRGVVDAIATGTTAKGDVLAAARVAGILAAKRTPELVPLCHPVRTTHAAIDFEPNAERGELRVRATIEAVDRTGVEMEAMVAASVASLTVYDMIKSADRWATIDAVRLDAKSGGKSGDLRRPPERGGA
jgi:cyclic pyranopterin phosphate synthase